MAERVTLGDVNQLCTSHDLQLTQSANLSNQTSLKDLKHRTSANNKDKDHDEYMHNLQLEIERSIKEIELLKVQLLAEEVGNPFKA